jgi:hypothetical protein
MRIRITQPGWEDFSDMFGTTAFKNGVSVHDVDPVQVARIGATVCIEDYEEPDVQIGPATDLLNSMTTTAPEQVEAERSTEIKKAEELARERAALAAAAEEARLAAVEAAARVKMASADDSVIFYTQSELEAIADNHGIRGLRAIGDKLSVRSTSVSGLIEAIMTAQGNSPNDEGE